jgi:hypothetical protein
MLPIVLFYANTTSDFARRAYWTDGSFRFLSPYIALLTIQALLFIKKVNGFTRAADYMLVAFIVWDLLNIDKYHLWEVAVAYPFVILMALIIILLFGYTQQRSKPGSAQGGMPLRGRRWVAGASALILLCAGLFFLQSYRDATRYTYFREISDLHGFPRNFVDAWEFLDQPGEKKTIALSSGWDPPSHKWFFYPLFGRRLQNEIAYVSAKHKWDVPTWVDRGLLRGDDYSIWLFNLASKKVQYILVQAPWPVEAAWMQRERELFELVFSNNDSKIFKYIGSSGGQRGNE